MKSLESGFSWFSRWCVESQANFGFVVATSLVALVGGGPRAVVSTAASHARGRGSISGFSGLKKNVSSPSTRKTQDSGEHP